MSIQSIKEQRLNQYMDEACYAMLAALPDYSGLQHEFSAEFAEKAEKLMQKVRRYRILHHWMRNIAAIFLVMVIGASVFLGANGEARADFFVWVHTIYENSIIYRFTGGNDEAALPTCELMWVPDGYKLVSKEQDEDFLWIMYETAEREGFQFICTRLTENNFVQIDETNHSIKKNVDINGISGELYMSADGFGTNDLIWMDEESGFAYMIDGTLEESVILHIAQNVIITK